VTSNGRNVQEAAIVSNPIAEVTAQIAAIRTKVTPAEEHDWTPAAGEEDHEPGQESHPANAP
jgi:hypothetical protein